MVSRRLWARFGSSTASPSPEAIKGALGGERSLASRWLFAGAPAPAESRAAEGALVRDEGSSVRAAGFRRTLASSGFTRPRSSASGPELATWVSGSNVESAWRKRRAESTNDPPARSTSGCKPGNRCVPPVRLPAQLASASAFAGQGASTFAGVLEFVSIAEVGERCLARGRTVRLRPKRTRVGQLRTGASQYGW